MKTFNLKYKKRILSNVEEELSLSKFIGQKVKEIKEEKNLKWKTIAKNGGLSNATICNRVVNGTFVITTETLYKICKGLDCKSSDLLPF